MSHKNKRFHSQMLVMYAEGPEHMSPRRVPRPSLLLVKATKSKKITSQAATIVSIQTMDMKKPTKPLLKSKDSLVFP